MIKTFVFLLIFKSFLAGVAVADVCCPGCGWFYENGDKAKLAYCFKSGPSGQSYIYRHCTSCDVTTCTPGVPRQCQGALSSPCRPPCQGAEKETQKSQKHQTPTQVKIKRK